MTPAHRRYFAIEMAIAAVINAILSAAFTFVVFGGYSHIAVAGMRGIAIDAAPQSFMITLMSCVVPTLLARRRVASGTVTLMTPAYGLPRRLAVRAVVLATAVAGLAVVIQAIVLPWSGDSWSFQYLLAFKCVYGALLGSGIAAFSIRFALGEATSGRPVSCVEDQ